MKVLTICRNLRKLNFGTKVSTWLWLIEVNMHLDRSKGRWRLVWGVPRMLVRRVPIHYLVEEANHN